MRETFEESSSSVTVNLYANAIIIQEKVLALLEDVQVEEFHRESKTLRIP